MSFFLLGALLLIACLMLRVRVMGMLLCVALAGAAYDHGFGSVGVVEGNANEATTLVRWQQAQTHGHVCSMAVRRLGAEDAASKGHCDHAP